MKMIKIQGNSAKSMILSLAEAFNSQWQESYGEYSLHIPEKIGKGTISGINFPTGVGLFKINVHLKKTLGLDFCSSDIHPFKFIYLIEGSIQHQFKDEDLQHNIDKGQSVILGPNYKSGNKILFPGGQQINMIILDIDREKFIDQLTFPLQEMNSVYHDIFADTNAIRTIFHHTQYSLKMAFLVDELNSFKAEGVESTSFHGAKALELLTYMLMLYKEDSASEEDQTIIKKKDLEKIKNIVRYIDENIEDVRNIKALADHEGINETKLREGFRILFNNTVHGYIQNRRLEYAMQLLLKTDKTISEIVYAIGLNSRSHFSKIFKEKYGESPTAIRQGQKL